MSRFIVAVALFSLVLSLAHSAPLPGPKKDGKTAEAEIHAIGVYEGTPAGFPGGVRRGIARAGQVTVEVQATARKPVILVLSAYEPVTWKIEAPPGAVAQVILSGYNAQKIEGLPPKTPLHSSSYTTGNRDYFYAFRAEAIEDRDDVDEAREELRKRDQRVKQLTGRAVSHSVGTYRGQRFTVRPGQAPAEVPVARDE